MRKGALIFLLTHLLIQQAIPQTDSLKLCCVYNRTIISDKTKIPLTNVHIQNISSGRGAVSNESGRFNLLVQEKDIVVVSRIDYKKIIQVIDPDDCNSSYDTLIMIRDTLVLSETVIYPYKNWQEFKRDFVEMDLTGTPQEKIIIKGVTQYEGPFIPQKPSPILNPVSYLYARYNKRGRLNHKLNKIRAKRKNKFSE